MSRGGVAAVAALLCIAAAKSPPPLAAYVGKYPFDKVQGVPFVGHPLVKSAVEDAAPGKMIERQLLSPEVSTPITSSQGVIRSTSCQTHNCPGVNWAIGISERTGAAAICFYQEELTDGARWFAARKLVFVDRKSDCQGEVPQQVLARIAE